MLHKGKIYKITNHKNNKAYIGCTIYSLDKRFYEHIYRCYNTDINTKLYNSIRKHGIENFSIELIEICDLEKIYETEKMYIILFDTYENGLNSTLGGEGCLGYKHSNEIRNKISSSLMNGNSHKGKKYDDLYGENDICEKEKRRLGVLKSWQGLTEEQKTNRLNNVKKGVRNKSKYTPETILEIKNQITIGLTNKEISKMFPEFNYNYISAIRNGIRWNDLN